MDAGGVKPYQFQGNSEYKREFIPNINRYVKESSDLGREGPRSRGKQPRSYAKVLKKI